ncbi:hypothetical protein BDV06DRAFT_201767 [Aspergillus oleicola]
MQVIGICFLSLPPNLPRVSMALVYGHWYYSDSYPRELLVLPSPIQNAAKALGSPNYIPEMTSHMQIIRLTHKDRRAKPVHGRAKILSSPAKGNKQNCKSQRQKRKTKRNEGESIIPS